MECSGGCAVKRTLHSSNSWHCTLTAKSKKLDRSPTSSKAFFKPTTMPFL